MPTEFRERVFKKGKATSVLKNVTFEDTINVRCKLEDKSGNTEDSIISLVVTGMITFVTVYYHAQINAFSFPYLLFKFQPFPLITPLRFHAIQRCHHIFVVQHAKNISNVLAIFSGKVRAARFRSTIAKGNLVTYRSEKFWL